MSKRSLVWMQRGVVVAACFALFAACDDDKTTGPNGSGPVDVAATAAALEDLADRFFNENEAILALNFMGPCAEAAGLGGLAVALEVASSALAAPGVALFAPWDSRVLTAEASAEIPESFLGKTLVYNTGGFCEIDEARTGAPANGVRIILYEPDPITGIVMPPNERGYADVVGTETATQISVDLEVVINSQTRVDFLLQINAQGTTGLNATANGAFTDAQGNDLDFNASANGTISGTAIDFSGNATATTTGIGFSGTASGNVNLVSESGSGQLDFDINLSDQDPISVEATLDAQGAVQGGVFFGNSEVAVLSGNLSTEQFSITAASGSDLTATELAGLESIFEGAGEVLEATLGILLLVSSLVGF